MTSNPPIIHYGLAPLKFVQPFLKCSLGIFRVPDLLFIIRGGFIHMIMRKGFGHLEFLLFIVRLVDAESAPFVEGMVPSSSPYMCSSPLS